MVMMLSWYRAVVRNLHEIGVAIHHAFDSTRLGRTKVFGDSERHDSRAFEQAALELGGPAGARPSARRTP